MDNINFERLKQIIIPYFIKIYGSEYETVIIDRINKIEPIFYSTIEGRKNEMYVKRTEKQIELTFKFLDRVNIDVSEELKEKTVESNSLYELNNNEEIKNILTAYFGTYSYEFDHYGRIDKLNFEPTDNKIMISKYIEKLNLLGINVTVDNFNEWILTEEAKIALQKIESIKKIICELDKEYIEFDSQYESLKESINKSDKLKQDINEKYMIEFLKSIQHYMTDHDKQIFDNYLVSDRKNWYNLTSELHILKAVGERLSSDGLIESFGSEADEKLKEPNVNIFSKNLIIENRIKYFELMGIYNGLPPEEFLHSEVAIANTPPQSCIDEILSKKDHYRQLAEEELLVSTSNYDECLEQIKKLNLVDGTSEFDIDVLKNKIKCIIPSAKIVNGKTELVPLLCFSPESCLSEYIDTMFMHEINHGIETVLLKCEGSNVEYKTGFEYINNSSDEERNYEQLSEVINQLIAIEVTELMHSDGVYLFDNPNTSKTRGGTSYEHNRMFVSDFLTKFKKEILLSRTSGNLEPLFKVVGKENFEKLNRIVNEYTKIPYYSMMGDIVNGRKTELTEKRKQLINRAQQVFKSMCEFASAMGYDDVIENSGYTI